MNRNNRIRVLLFFVSAILLLNCSSKQKKLPYYGPREIKNISVENGLRADTIYHTIPDFRFVDQDSAFITPATFENKIYVADFFFTTCPTICIAMTDHMLQIQNEIINDDEDRHAVPTGYPQGKKAHDKGNNSGDSQGINKVISDRKSFDNIFNKKIIN